MDGFKALFDGLAANLPIAMLAITLIAIGWLVKALIASYEAKSVALQAANVAHLETAMQIAPLAQNLVKCVEMVERQMTRHGGA